MARKSTGPRFSTGGSARSLDRWLGTASRQAPKETAQKATSSGRTMHDPVVLDDDEGEDKKMILIAESSDDDDSCASDKSSNVSSLPPNEESAPRCFAIIRPPRINGGWRPLTFEELCQSPRPSTKTSSTSTPTFGPAGPSATMGMSHDNSARNNSDPPRTTICSDTSGSINFERQTSGSKLESDSAALNAASSRFDSPQRLAGIKRKASPTNVRVQMHTANDHVGPEPTKNTNGVDSSVSQVMVDLSHDDHSCDHDSASSGSERDGIIPNFARTMEISYKAESRTANVLVSSQNTGSGSTRTVAQAASVSNVAPANTSTSSAVYSIDDDNDEPNQLPPPICARYTLQKFVEMWERTEETLDLTTEELESSKAVRAANSRVTAKDGCGQGTAQYGRILPQASQEILDNFLRVDATRGDVVVDIGCGIGNFVLQAAFVSRCEARGIEIDHDRFFIAKHGFEHDLCIQQHRKLHLGRDNTEFDKGKTKFIHGRLEAEEYRDFLTKPTIPGGTIRAFCNNFNGVFGCRTAGTKHALDCYVAGLFALFPAGSILVTLDPLPLQAQHSEILDIRNRHFLDTTSNPRWASFYEYEKHRLGQSRDVVSWGTSNNPIYIYKYTRLSQSTPNGEAVFQCSNYSCEKAQSGEPIPATKVVEVEITGDDGVKRMEHRVIMNSCKCNHDARPTRSGAKRR
jgi:SAM-dependent methyltransferase